MASRKHLASIVAGKQVAIEYQKRDRYDRIVGKVWVNGIDVCLEQVKAGFACDLCLSHGQCFSHSGGTVRLGITLASLSKSSGYTPFGVQPCTVLSGK